MGESVPAVDIVVRWGDWVLLAKELSPPRSFVVGEEAGCDVVLPAEIIGGPAVPVLLGRWDGEVKLVVPSSAAVSLDGRNKRLSAARVIAKGQAVASKVVRDAAEVELAPGRKATLFFGRIEIDVTCSTPAERSPRKPILERRLGLSHALSATLHLALGALLSFTMPLPDDMDGGVTDDQKFYIQQALSRAAEKEEDGTYSDELSGYKRRARRNERRNKSFLDSLRQQEWLDSLSGGNQGWSGKSIAQAQADGENDPDALNQDLFGAFYDRLPPPKPAPVHVVLADGRQVAAPKTTPSTVRYGAMTVSGRLPPEVIHRIIRQNFGRFRLCYEQGLRNNPNLQGRVSVRFVIGRDGAISNVANGGSDMPDGGVVNCIVRAFYGLSFPQPEGGIVTVVYPIMFAPGG